MKMINLKTCKMMAMAAFAMGVLTVTGSCMNSVGAGNAVVNGNLTYNQADLTVKPFTKIEVETVADVYYVQNNTDKQEVRFDFSKIKNADLQKQYKEKVKAVYRDGKLVIGLSGKITGASNLKAGERLEAYVSSPDLVKVTLEGVGSFHTDAINSDVFEIDNEGVGSVYVKDLLANKVSIDNEGVGNVTIDKLQADNLDIDNEGVGNVNIGKFKGGRMKIDNEGVGKVQADVDCQSINATLEGVGNIRLSGVTRHFTRTKEGVGSFKVSDLKVLEQ